jgi:hypothetical protein
MNLPKPKPARPLRLVADPLIEQAERLVARVHTELPSHDGLARAAAGVAAAAIQAERVSRSMNRLFSIHRLPVFFLAGALLCLALWIYWQFFHVSTLRIALPDRDAAAIRKVASGKRVSFRQVEVPGSHEALEQVISGQVDLAFVQGGFEIPPELPRLETPSPELVLWMVRDSVNRPRDVRHILTSLSGEGSHTVAQAFVAAWHDEQAAVAEGIGEAEQKAPPVEYVHDWRDLTLKPNYEVPSEIDAVLVVKDPSDDRTLAGIARLSWAGFRLQSPNLGARAGRYDYLAPTTIAPGFLCPDPAIPAGPIPTYSVKTYLVARQGLTPRLLAEAAHVLDARPAAITDGQFDPTTSDTSDIFQGIESFLGIIVNIGLAFLALLGLDVMMYRKQFHELNSLVSLLSMLQSNKDVLGLADQRQKTENLLYLGLVSDLLGLISMISSYYTQENSSLLFNNLSEVIHQRCDGLKINIQLKILHATVDIPRLSVGAGVAAIDEV